MDQVAAYDGCVALHLGGIGAHNAGVRRVVLHPFDRLEPVDRRRRMTPVTRDLWLRALEAVAAASVPWGSLRAAAGAHIDLLPYQFAPALALVRGLASRVLIADAVGLGKTIQAALVIAELKARDESARALVVTPAGLREQWIQELDRRFSIPALIIDALQLRRATASLPADVNPWETAPVVVTSLDFVRLPEVSRALDATVWDLVVVDEAHMIATARERRLAIDGLGARARWVVLLTATPHAGDESGFASLCGIGDPEKRGPI
ncbi:MAG: DEAD/DEAH box helicase, partial [Acidobacteria bacterium]|nr:DEAD/DEAH box helicase [Acidobacteriota bacterium]